MRGAGLVTGKGGETRERILDAALQLFRERGFDETTMRDIAADAEVATGAAYYYFRSKEELVMAFYVRTADEAREVLPQKIERSSRDLKKRLRTIIDHKFEQFAGHRALLVGLSRIGIDPKHPLSPFGKQTQPMRDESIEFFRTAIEGSSTKITADLRDDLPRLLWMHQMGIVLFWLFDDSRDQRRTKRLTDGSLDLIVRLVQISSLPLMGPLRKRLLSLLRSIDE